jgi:zinc transport system ATP-binding protein
MEGTVRVLGTTPAVARGRVGYVPQTFQFDPRFPLTIGDAVRMGCLGLRARRERLAHLVDRALDRVGLGGFGSRPFEALSGGQRQRVLIARAIVADPEVLLLDEPTAHVDPAVQRGVYALLREIGERMTVILVTHDAGFVSELVRSVYCVNHRVTRHGVLDLPDASDALLRLVTGGPFRVVAHDESCQEEADGG